MSPHLMLSTINTAIQVISTLWGEPRNVCPRSWSAQGITAEEKESLTVMLEEHNLV